MENGDLEQRRLFFDVWKKMNSKQKLNDLDKQLAKIVNLHPEFHPILSDPDKYAEHEFQEGQTDPFYHLAMHSLLAELISNDNPEGIRSLYDRRINETEDKHAVQHEFMGLIFDWMMGSEDEDWNTESLLSLIDYHFDKMDSTKNTNPA